MLTSIGVGVGSGLVSAILFAVVVTGSPLGVLLSYLAPLPIFIATLGWPHRIGFLAACVGTVATILAVRWNAGLAYAIGLGFPAWWLGYLAMLGRQSGDGRAEWYPTGRLLLWIVAVATVVTFLGALTLGGSFAEYRETMRRVLSVMLGADSGPNAQPLELPDGFTQDDLFTLVLAAIPVVSAAFFVPIQSFNLWLAAKVVSMSGRLTRPWPDISTTRMPRPALAALGIGLVVAATTSGFPAFVGQALSGALVAAFALQGLGAIHAVSRGRPARAAILVPVYLLLLILNVWVLPILALVGIIDTLSNRVRANPLPPTNPS